MESSFISYYGLSDKGIVRELGKSIKQMRINENITQQKLAEKTGLDRVTISRLENGSSATLLTFVQILRALNQLDRLKGLHEEPAISPLMVAEMEAKHRKRASKKKVNIPPKKESEW
jgi:transcriptional regulator with XRE-family HTH domain